MTQKVYIVGMGIISSLGNSVHELWTHLLASESGMGINAFGTFRTVCEDYDPREDDFHEMAAAEVKEFDPLKWMDRRDANRMDPFSQFALAAATQAVEQSGLEITEEIGQSVAAFIGTGQGGLITHEYQQRIMYQKGVRRVSPHMIPMLMSNAGTHAVARHFYCHAAGDTPVAACASGAFALGKAFRGIRAGDIDAAIAGGSEASITPLCVAGFKNMRALSTYTGNPAQASRPFDEGRKGFVIGEGAGVLMLASEAFVLKHHLTPIGRIGGFGQTQDAYHLTAPHPKGTYAALAVQIALRDAGIEPHEIVYVNPHGTGTDLNDTNEINVLRDTLGDDHASRTPVSSTKSMIGHTIGAAGAIEAIVCALTLANGVAHPTVNLDSIDPTCMGVDYIIGEPRRIPKGAALTNSFGFGGENAALILLPVD